MEPSKAYDLPIRIFHWLFALLFLLSFSIGEFVDDDSALYAYHMLSGLLMVFLFLLRVVWGVAGSKTAKFKSFRLRPKELVSYFTSLFSADTKRHLGHNPASSYAAIAMMFFALALGTTGVLMSLKISKNFIEDIHELLAKGFLITVIFHIVGVSFHQFRHNDGMMLSMINGNKNKVVGEEGIKSNHPIVAFLFTILVVGMGGYLLNNFDRATGTLHIFSTDLQLGESKAYEHEKDLIKYEENFNSDHDDDD